MPRGRLGERQACNAAHSVQRFAGCRLDNGDTRLALADRDFSPLVGCVRVEPQFAVESARQARVDSEELIDSLLVSRAGAASCVGMSPASQSLGLPDDSGHVAVV